MELVKVIAVTDPNRVKGEEFECTKDQAKILVDAGYCKYAKGFKAPVDEVVDVDADIVDEVVDVVEPKTAK